MRLIDADRLLEPRRIETYYHLKNGDIAIPLIDIKHAPTIEERKKGKWVKKRNSDLLYCSECDLPSMHNWPYCERCGADMRG